MKSKKQKMLSLLLAGLLLQTALAGCAGPEESSVVESTTSSTTPVTETPSVTGVVPETVTVTDAAGREITIDLPVERVCYLNPAIAEGLRIVDAWDRVIAKDNYTFDTIIFPGIEDLPELPYANSGLIDYEKILELQPDVLLVLPAGGSIDLEEAIAKLEPEVPVISVFDTYNAETWSKGIELLGAIMQQEDKASEFVTFVQEIENTVTSKTKGLTDTEKPGVFLKVSGWTIDQFSSFTNELAFIKKLMDVAGGRNIAAGLPSMGGWVQDIDPEWLIIQEYDYVLVDIWRSYYPGAMGLGVKDTSLVETVREELVNMSELSDSKAVADGNLYLMDHELIMSIRYPMLLAYTAKILHPDLFSDMDPEAFMNEYLTRFLQIEPCSGSYGVFMYPNP
jgi:iron complex transport system substrate-binding protein